jgi:hypothetical protein
MPPTLKRVVGMELEKKTDQTTFQPFSPNPPKLTSIFVSRRRPLRFQAMG